MSVRGSELSSLNMTCRPIDVWPGALTPDGDRERGRFRKSWGAVVADLAAELRMIQAQEPVMLLALAESEITVDGTRPKANARPRHPGVVIAFNSVTHGPMKIACDHFNAWVDNIQAIAVGLHDRRRLERYGIIKRDEVYTSWQALPPPGGRDITTAEQAASIVAEIAARPETDVLAFSVGSLQMLYRIGAKKTHPDHGGSPEAFDRFKKAIDFLISRAGGAA